MLAEEHLIRGGIFNSLPEVNQTAKIAEPGGSLDAVKRGGANAERSLAAQVTFIVPGGCAAWNRGADYVKLLAPALRARTRSLTRHREPYNQATLACKAPGAGQHRD